MNRLKLNVKNILRILAIISAVLFFCPSFSLSYAGLNYRFSGSTLMIGINAAMGINTGGYGSANPYLYGSIDPYYYKGMGPHPFLVVCLVLPAIMIILLFARKISKHMSALIISICAGINIIIWLVLNGLVRNYFNYVMTSVNRGLSALLNIDISAMPGVGFSITGLFVVNIIALATITILGIAFFFGKIEMGMSIPELFSIASKSKPLKTASAVARRVVNHAKELATNSDSSNNAAGYCKTCGTPYEKGGAFCTKCGRPIEEDEDGGNRLNNKESANKENAPEQNKASRIHAEKVHKCPECPTCGNLTVISKDGEYYLCHTCRKRYRRHQQ